MDENAAPVPLVRARHLKVVLEAIDRHPRRAEIRAAVAPPVLSLIDEATGTDWLPVDLDVALAVGLHTTLGADGLDAFNLEMMQQALRGPLLRALVELATALLGLDAGSWVLWIPKGWALTFRDCGKMTVVRGGAGEATLTITGLPPICALNAVWPPSVASSLSAMLPAAKAEGTVKLQSLDLSTRTAIYDVRWRAGPG